VKFREEIRKRTVPRTIAGVTHDVSESYSVRVPVIPRDLDQLAVRIAAGLVLALTLVGVAWSTVSIGGLLGGGIGYAAAVVFDVSWMVVLLIEWMARFDPAKRQFPRKLGWALVFIAAGAIFWHGMLAGSPAMAVVGASVSVVSKVLWMAVMKFIDRDLSEADQQWVAAEVSKANAQLAVASVRRMTAAAESRAALELLAAEQIRTEVSAVADTANTPEPIAEPVTAGRPPVPLASPNPVREPAEPVPSIAELARQQLAAGANNKGAAAEILRLIPTANADSVQATVRRERNRLQTNGYL